MNWQDIPGRLFREEGEALRALAAVRRVLEIGSLFGRSIVCLAQVAAVVHAVDPHRPGNTDWCDEFRGRDSLQELRNNLWTAGVLHKVTLHICTVAELWLPAAPIFDLAFVDGSHAYRDVRLDLAFAEKAIAPNGIIACHDYDRGGPRKAVDEFCALHHRSLELVRSLAILRPVP